MTTLVEEQAVATDTAEEALSFFPAIIEPAIIEMEDPFGCEMPDPVPVDECPFPGSFTIWKNGEIQLHIEWDCCICPGQHGADQ